MDGDVMTDLSLIFILAGIVMFFRQALAYRNQRIADRNVEVNRLRDTGEFCRYASRYQLINGVILIGLFAIVAGERFAGMAFHPSWYFGLLLIFLFRAFRFPRSFEAYYKPVTMDSDQNEKDEPIDEGSVDE